MKGSLDQLPPHKRDELDRVASVIREVCRDVEMIILFGSYARGQWKEEADLKPHRKSGHKSDYDVLVVVADKATAKDTAVWQTVRERCDTLGLSAHVRTIVHDVQFFNARLAEGHFFYSDIKKEGCLLYDSGNFKLARKRKLKPADRRRIAEKHYDKWFGSAKGFYRFFEVGTQEGNLNGAAFSLNQVTESCYKAILLVFTNYCPHEHLLGLLEEMAVKHDASLADVFPRETYRQDEAFKLLDYAYIGARYDEEFVVFPDDLEYLSGRVRLLLELTERICKARIAAIA